MINNTMIIDCAWNEPHACRKYVNLIFTTEKKNRLFVL